MVALSQKGQFMQIVKYIISVILLLVVSFSIVEGYAQHTSSFEIAYSEVAVKPVSTDAGSVRSSQSISELAKKNSVEVFERDYRFESAFSNKIKLYCTEGMETILQDKSLIVKGDYASLFIGHIEINIYPITEMHNLSAVSEYYVYGDTADIYHFSDDIGGKIVSDGTQSENTGGNDYVLLWLLVLLSSIILTLYDVALLRKEVIIRLVSGQNIKWFVFKRSATDAVFYCLLFIIAFFVISQISSLRFYFINAGLWMALIIITNAALYLLLLLTDYKKDVHTGLRAKRVLKISYVYKFITVLITLIVVMGCVETIAGSVVFYRQNNIFSNHKNYSYYQISTEDIYRDDELRLNLYKEYLKQNKTFTMVELEDPDSYDDNYIYADAGALPYLKQQLPELENIDFKHQVYFIKPSDYNKTGNGKDASKKAFDISYKGAFHSEEIQYKGTAKLLACDGSTELIGVGTTKLKKNPIIILNNITGKNLGIVDPYVTQSAMLDITDEEWQSFVSENNLQNDTVYKTNAYENFYNQWRVKRNSALLSAALICMMFLIEVILIRNILKFEFYVNARLLVLKKILGYSILQRYQRIITITILCTLLSSVCAAVITSFITPGMWIYIIIAAAIVIFVELLLIAICIHKLERRNIQRTLKGSIL